MAVPKVSMSIAAPVIKAEQNGFKRPPPGIYTFATTIAQVRGAWQSFDKWV
jgi:hypothetical protein